MLCEYHRPSDELKPFVDFLVCMQWAEGTAYIRNFPPAQLSIFLNYGENIFIPQSDELGSPPKSLGGNRRPVVQRVYPRMMLEGLRTGPSDYFTPGKTGIVVAALKPLARTAFRNFGGEFALRDNIRLDEIFGTNLPDVPSRLAQTNSVRAKFAIVEDFLRGLMNPTVGIDQARAIEVFQLVTSNPHLPVEVLSRSVGLSKRHFDRIFQASIGTSPKHYARVLRMQQSLHLINNPALSLTQVAHEVGFHDQSHFIRDFKNLTGFTPSAYRNQQQNSATSQNENPLTIVCDSNLVIPAA